MSNSLELRGRLALVKTKVSVEEVNQYLPRKRREVIRLSVDEQNKPASMKREIKRAAKHVAEDPDSFFEALLMEAASRKHTYIEDRVLTAIRSGQKVVVFTGRRLDCERLADKLKRLLGDKVPKAQVWWGHGGVDTTERDEIRREYMASPGPSLLVGTGDAWGESIDLQDTDLAIIAMLPWTPDKVIQWEGRFSRLGQKRPVLVSYIIARNTADDHVADLLIDKLPHVGEIGEDRAALEIEQVLGGVDESDEARQSLLERVSRLASP
jgi:superfamily II DNA/RNA helicase